MSAAALKKCPFCGSTNLHQTGNGIGSEFVECADCGASGPASDHSASAEEYWNSRAIAPPVAAGSVDSIDTNEFCDLMTELQDVHQRLGNCKPNWDALIAHIHAWGEQQREAGQHEGALVSLNNYDAACDEYRKQIAALTGRAEKAEARIDELEAQLAAAKPYDLKA